jgi:hypothetical protein
MKFAAGAVLFVSCLAVPASTCALPASCGPDDSQFKVTTESGHPVDAHPAAGKALFIFLDTEDTAGLVTDPVVSTRIGLDGAWIGGTRGDSYFAYQVEPGEHHVCVNWPGDFGPEWKRNGAVAVKAEPGKVYWLRIEVRLRKSSDSLRGFIDADKSLSLALVDGDEGAYLSRFLERSTAIPVR